MEKVNNPEEEELYALLDAALQDDTISVSEELIQKTLQRANEEVSTIAYGSGKKRFIYSRFLPYGTMAAAAVLVLFLGGRALGGMRNSTPQSNTEFMQGMLGSKNAEATADSVSGGSNYETATAAEADGLGNGGKDSFWQNGANSAEVVEKDGRQEKPDAIVSAEERVWLYAAESYVLAEEVCEQFRMMGYGLLENLGKQWFLTQNTEADWNTLLSEMLRTNGTELFETAETLEVVMQDTDGMMVLGTKQPQAMIFLKTEQGEFWAVAGETIRILR